VGGESGDESDEPCDVADKACLEKRGQKKQ